MRTKGEILDWILESKSSISERIALVEVLLDIRDLLVKKKEE